MIKLLAPLNEPFALHLKDSIIINTKRTPKYAILTLGKSVPFSGLLIFSEQVSMPFAMMIDRLTKPYREAGIPIGDLEFIHMDTIPEFSNSFPFTPEPLDSFKALDGKALLFTLQRAFREGSFAGLSAAATETYQELEVFKAYHCMTRHLLQSLIRICNLAPLHQAKALELGVKSHLSCKSISKMMVWGHLISFPGSADLDKKVAPIQAKGIPFLWQDVPEIPPTSSFYSAL
jgi:hypothetical protein